MPCLCLCRAVLYCAVLCCAVLCFSRWLAGSARAPPQVPQAVGHPYHPAMVPRNEEQVRRPPPNPRLLSVQSVTSKYSFRSHSSAFEADDERSTTTDSGSMSPRESLEDGATPRGDRYPGEDTRPTSSKELAGWYMYAFAAETYMICGTPLPQNPGPLHASFRRARVADCDTKQLYVRATVISYPRPSA